MAIGNSYLTSVRQYMRLTTKAHDSEIKDLINAARADLALGGVLEVKALDEKDPLILRAVATYVKAEFGLDNADADKYRESYNMLKRHLMLSSEYLEEA